MRLLVATVALTVLPMSACSSDPFEDYCGAVEDHQTELTEITSGEGATALLGALDIFRDLQEQAPSDITDEWQQVVGRLEALDEALDDAGVDPASYDRDDPPAGLDDAERSRIEAAATALVAPETAAAFEGLQQQARDVCKTPLTL
jgi:hypothetical protein